MITPRRFLLSLLAACALGAVLTAGGEAHAYDLSALDGAEVVSDGEMEEQRGAFIAIDGMVIGFGATVRTFANGDLALASQFTWTPNGVVTTQTAAAAATQITAEVADQLAGLGVNGLAGLDGYALIGPQGATAIIHRADEHGVQNFIINSQNDSAFRQEVDLNFIMPGFDVMQENMSLDRLGLQIRDDVMAAAMAWR